MCICRVVKCFAFSVTGFGQICARWRAVVVNYNKSTDCTNMSKAVRLKCSTEVGYGYVRCLSPVLFRSRISNHIPKANTFYGRGGIRLLIATRGYLRYENMIDYVCFLH